MAKKATDLQRYDGGDRAPKAACVFACPQGCTTFAAGGDGDGQFEIMAYDGGIAEHLFWDQIAIDLEGVRFTSKRLPVLDTHQVNARVGFTTENSTDSRVILRGQFLSNPTAQELRKDMQQGFPMQASLGVKPLKIERLEKNATAMVNGRTMRGPGVIFRQTEIVEVSMCTFGAMKNTKSTAFADTDTESIEFELVGDNQMSEKEKQALTLDTFKADHAELFKSVRDAAFAEGQKTERERFASLQKACGDDHALLVECFASPTVTTADALGKSNEKLRAQLKAAHEKLSAAPAVSGKERPDAARVAFSEQPRPSEAPTQFNEAEATDEQLKEHFAKTPDVQAEFGSVDAYVAFVNADRDGRVKIKS